MPTSRTSPPAHHRRWSGVPAADRLTERRTLLLDAAFELLGTDGWAGTTVRAVCERARLNPRYFYESFPDLDALVIAVYDRVVAELGHEVLAALHGAPEGDPAAQVRAAVRCIVGFVDDDRRRARVLYVEALGNEALNRRRIATGQAVAAFLLAYAADKPGAPPPGEAIGAEAAAVLVGGFSELLVEWLEGRIPASAEQLVDDATALFLALGDAASAIADRRRRPTGPKRRRK